MKRLSKKVIPDTIFYYYKIPYFLIFCFFKNKRKIFFLAFLVA